MAILSINLLPPEVLAKEKTKNRLAIVNQISLSLLMLLITLAGTILALRLLQGQKLSQDKKDLDVQLKSVESLKKQEGLLVNLKKRIDLINTFSKQESKQLSSFSILLQVKPPNLKTNFLGLDKVGNITYSGESSSAADLRTFFDNMLNPKLTEGRINKIKVESLGRSVSDKFKFDLTIGVK